jgi:type II pantothenate kinase
MTASNLARLNRSATDADWAAGLTNLVLQSLGTMSLLACRSSGADCIIVTGAMAGSAAARVNFKGFSEMYGVPYIIPPNCECATAIGAARLAR